MGGLGVKHQDPHVSLVKVPEAAIPTQYGRSSRTSSQNVLDRKNSKLRGQRMWREEGFATRKAKETEGKRTRVKEEVWGQAGP